MPKTQSIRDAQARVEKNQRVLRDAFLTAIENLPRSWQSKARGAHAFSWPFTVAHKMGAGVTTGCPVWIVWMPLTGRRGGRFALAVRCLGKHGLQAVLIPETGARTAEHWQPLASAIRDGAPEATLSDLEAIVERRRAL